MKKFLFSAAMAATLLASCSKNDAVEGYNYAMSNTIDVTAMVNGNPTRTAAVETTTSAIGSFKMYMYNDGEAIAEGLKFTKPAAGSAEGTPWSHDGIYYWAEGSYKFFGLAQDNSADNAISQVAVTKDGITIGTASNPYVIATDGATSDPTYGPTGYTGGIYGDAVTAVSQVDPVVAAESVTRATGNTGSKITKMQFYHALSRVRLTLDSYDPKTSKLKLVVVGYEFRKVGVEGYTTAAIADTDDASSVAWTTKKLGAVRENSVALPASYTYTGSSKNLIPTDSWCNVIPGENVAVALVVKCALYDNTNNYVATRYLTTTQSLNTDNMKNSAGKHAYLPGTQYTYHVNITSDGGDDTDTSNPGVDQPGFDGPDEGIEGLTIKITEVTVQAWQPIDGGTVKFEGEE